MNQVTESFPSKEIYLFGFLASEKEQAEKRTNLGDDSLIKEIIRTGQDDLFCVLVNRYKDRVFRLVVSILGPTFSAESEEVVQEVFLAVHRQLHRFRFESKFSTWLYRIAYRRAIDQKRKIQSGPNRMDGEVLTQLPSKRTDLNPLKQTLERERQATIQSSVERLSEPYRTVIYLHYWLDCSVAEIAEYLNAKPSTVKSHLFRGRQRLSKRLEERFSHA